jgi:hypothetical protein
MLARLWWKDARQFWPIWLFLGLVAVGAQWALTQLMGPEVRTGMLGAVALGWASLYGCAVAAAAVAGERESRTLALLDAMGLDRPQFWRGKASFAAVSTLMFGALLFALSALGTKRWETDGVGLALVVAGGAAVLLEVLGWGLLWSSATRNPLVAAILTVCSLLVVPLFTLDRDSGPRGLVSAAPWRLGVAAATAAASYALVVRDRPGRAARRRRRVRAGNEVESARARGAWWRPALRSLVWQSVREGRPVWLRLAALYFGLCAVVGLVDSVRNVHGLALALSWPIGIVAGVNAYGAETRARTHRFLAHHGARPGLVWLVKAGVCVLGLMLLWVPTLVLAPLAERVQGYQDMATPPGAVVIALAFATSAGVGALCGMTIRRGITAVLVAAVVLVMGTFLGLMLSSQRMAPAWGLGVVPVACVFVSWAWSADWLFERPGTGRWVRLALLLVCTGGLVFSIYTAHRALAVPLIDPMVVGRFARPASPESVENAAVLYAKASRLRTLPSDRDAEALAILRRAASVPSCRFTGEEQATLFSPLSLEETNPPVGLLVNAARKSLSRGELGPAWEDLMATFRAVRHLTHGTPLVPFVRALLHEHDALALAIEWAGDPKQDPERLAAALQAYQALPPMPTAAETIATEARLTERTLNLPGGALAEYLSGRAVGSDQSYAARAEFWARLWTTPWEMVRARRACRLLFAGEAELAALEPSERPGPDLGGEGWTAFLLRDASGHGMPRLVVMGSELHQIHQSTPLARELVANFADVIRRSDRNEVYRRALAQVLALRRWQLRHDGKLPTTLDALTTPGGGLARLPKDPYNAGPFHFEPSEGQQIWPLYSLRRPDGESNGPQMQPTAGARLLYSVGSDRVDNRAYVNEPEAGGSGSGDIIFPLPDKPGAVPPPPRNVPDLGGPPMGGAAMGGMLTPALPDPPVTSPPDDPR